MLARRVVNGSRSRSRHRGESDPAVLRFASGQRPSGVYYFGFSGILLRTVDHVLAFDLGLFTIRRREIVALRQLDLQLHTHAHFDHWSACYARAIHKATGAPIAVEPQIAGRAQDSDDWLMATRPGEPIAIADMTVSPIQGIHVGPITLFHVAMPELTVFHGGDSNHVPLDQLKADLAFVPTGRPSPTCTPQSAVAMLRDLRPKVAIPMHAPKRQMREFKRLARSEVPDTRIVVPRRRVPFVIDVAPT